jgi:integrase
MILRVHLVPALGHRKLDAISNEDVQRLKTWLGAKASKTVNNVLTVLSVLLKKAVEWNVIEGMSCSIRLLPVPTTSVPFYDFDEYERLVEAARKIDPRTYLVVLLGGESGLRCGEMIALEWADVDLGNRPLTVRLAAALREHRHLRSSRVLCQDDSGPLTRQMVQNRMKLAARRSGCRAGVHILRHSFCSHLAMRGAPAKAIQELVGHKDLSMTLRYMHLSPASLETAIRLLDSPALICRRGNIVATASDASTNC